MSENPLDFTGKVVLITGASGGIGKAAALAFARAGASVVIGDVDDRAQQTVDEIVGAGGTALYRKTDVTKAADLEALVATAVEDLGGLDVAFNNAGVLPPTGPLLDQDEAMWDKVVDVDLKGVFLAMRAELAHMVPAGKGSIINTASVAGVIADPGMAPYVAAKHGVVGLSRAAAIDYAESGVRINALAPGLTATEMTKGWLDDPDFNAVVTSNTPMKRPATPEEIVGMVLYLASDLASYTNGGVFIVDGGQTAH